MSEKKLNRIYFKCEIEGKDIVNYNGKYHPEILKAFTTVENAYYNNNKVAKRNCYKTSDGKNESKIKISSDCLNYNLFGTYTRGISQSVVNTNIDNFINILANYGFFIRGYVFNKSEKNMNVGYKRKSAVCLTSAEEIPNDNKNIVSTMDTHTTSGLKSDSSNMSEDDTSKDTTFRNEEHCGDIKYAFEGSINIEDLQFLSCSVLYDRMALDADNIERYINLFISNANGSYNKFNIKELTHSDFKIDYYKYKNHPSKLAEKGILMSDNVILNCINFYFKQLLNFKIVRNNAKVNISKIEYKLVYDDIVDTFKNPDNWKILLDTDNNTNIESALENLSELINEIKPTSDSGFYEYYETVDNGEEIEKKFIDNIKTGSKNKGERANLEKEFKKLKKKIDNNTADDSEKLRFDELKNLLDDSKTIENEQ